MGRVLGDSVSVCAAFETGPLFVTQDVCLEADVRCSNGGGGLN